MYSTNSTMDIGESSSTIKDTVHRYLNKKQNKIKTKQKIISCSSVCGYTLCVSYGPKMHTLFKHC